MEALSTLTDVGVTCDTGMLCNGTAVSTCYVEFLTELADVPLISSSVSNIDSLTVTEYQVSNVQYVTVKAVNDNTNGIKR